jgi:hypothetical protein
MKCVICDKRKPKRYCPAKRASICPVCCGEKRGVEINCPPDCRYFVEGQKQHHKKIMQQRIRKEGPGSYVRRTELYKHNPEIFARLEMVFAAAYRSNRAIKNEDLVSALELAGKTLETEGKGLIYQHRSESSSANEISDNILAVISQYKDTAEIGENRVTLDYATAVIEEFLNEAKFYMENDSNPSSYLIHILRYYPEEPQERAEKSGLIITP